MHRGVCFVGTNATWGQVRYGRIAAGIQAVHPGAYFSLFSVEEYAV
jgi:hypothetical protein